jgi:CRP-like cAMP-binding protein
MTELFEHIKSITHLSQMAQEALFENLTKVEIKKGEILVKENSICQHLYFIESGAVRGFYFLDTKEITHWFGFENDFCTSFYSFISRKPAKESIQALEDCVLYAIGKDALETLYQKHPELERMGRIACEQYYIRLENRYVSSQFKTATERYLELINSKTEFLQRIALGHIASYLGISQETLSRIRAKK